MTMACSGLTLSGWGVSLFGHFLPVANGSFRAAYQLAVAPVLAQN